MGQHLVFYDGECGLCDQIVQLILKYDHKRVFDFAPLQGSTATTLLTLLPKTLRSADSMVLIENYREPDKRRIFLFGQAALRVAWIMGGIWSIPGSLSWLPPCLYNWGYRFVASHRHHFFSNRACVVPLPEHRSRFLP